MRIVGEAQQQWAPLRRKYNLFLFNDPSANQPQSQQLQQANRPDVAAGSGQFSQFAYVDEPFLSWDFSLRSAESQLIGSVNRNFAGFAREIFTDTGMYALRMDSASLAEESAARHLISQTNQSVPQAYNEKAAGMTLDQRAVMLATAVSIDFDYFSRHSNSGGIMPIPFFGMGSAGEGAAAGGAATEGAAGSTAAGEAMTGAAAAGGTMAGYEAMQRGMSSDSQNQQIPPQQQSPVNQGEEVWGESDNELWGGGRAGPPHEGSDGSEFEGEQGDGDDWGDFF